MPQSMEFPSLDQPWRGYCRCSCRFPARNESSRWGLRLATPQSGWPAQRDRKARSFIRMEIRRRCTGHRCTSAWQAWPSESKSQIGDALAIVKKTPGMFDVIFIDVDKNQYPAALHAVRPKLRRGGLLITDNTIWSGKAARPAPEEDKDTKGVQEFNRMVYASKELYPVLIPLRDGLTICRKS